jgi:outer membrane cobalamin receptor
MAAVLAIAAAWLAARDGQADDRAPSSSSSSSSSPATGDSLATPFALRGTVHDSAHSPVEGSLVEVFGSLDTSVAQARADSHGAFDLPPLPGGSYRIVVSHSGFMTSEVAVDLGPTTGPLDVILEAAAAAQVPAVQEVQVRGDRGAGPGQTGSSVSVLSRKDVQALPGGDAQSLSQIMLTQPGFTPDTFGPDGLLHIRGEETGVLYVVDGVPIPGGLAGQFTDVLPTGLVEGVRLISGGQPVEYGPNPGGVVDVTTRHGTGTPEGAVQMVYGTYQKAQPSAWYSQAFGKADVFVAGTFLSTQRGLDPPAVSPILHDGLKSGSAFTRVDVRPNERERIELLARYSQADFQIPIDPTLLPLSDGPPNAMRGPDIYGNSPPQFVPYNANPTEAERDLFVTLSYSYAFPSGRVQIAPYVRSSYGDYNCDPAGSLGATADPGSLGSDVTRNLLHEGQTATVAWAAGERQRWKAGVAFDAAQSGVGYTQFTRYASAMAGPDPALTVSGRNDTQFFAGGAFLQDEMTFGNLKIFPGLRADLQDASFAGTHEPNLLLTGPSARLGVSYSFSKTVVLHAFAGYIWQPPNAVDAAVAARVLNVAPGQPISVDVKAERDESAEVGLSYRLPRRFEASLTGYGRISQDTLDVQTVGSTNLIEDYNYDRGQAVGAEFVVRGTANPFLQGFGNASWSIDRGKGIDSGRYLFTQAQVDYVGWQTLDHVQRWTVNAGVDLHDASEKSHLAVLFQYGSGLRTGPDNDETVPGHATWNLTLRHRFDLPPIHPEVAVDVFNVFDAVYALRIANGFVGSAYGALRQVDVRLMVPFGG